MHIKDQQEMRAVAEKPHDAVLYFIFELLWQNKITSSFSSL